MLSHGSCPLYFREGRGLCLALESESGESWSHGMLFKLCDSLKSWMRLVGSTENVPSKLGLVVPTFNPNTHKAVVGGSLESLQPDWSVPISQG